MADDDGARPSPPSGGGFSLSKRYGPLPAWGWGLIGGVGIYALYRFYESRQSSSSAPTATASTYPTDFGPQIATLQAEIQQLQGGESTEGGTTTTPTTKPVSVPPDQSKPPPAGAPPPVKGGGKVMPNVVGQRANFAIGELKSGYGVRATTIPVRSPRNEYTVTGQTPRAGAKIKAGTPAVLRVKVIKKGAA